MLPGKKTRTILEKLDESEKQADFKGREDYSKNIEKLALDLKQYSGYAFSHEYSGYAFSKDMYLPDLSSEDILKKEHLNGIHEALEYLSAFIKSDLFKKEDSKEARIIKMERWIAVMKKSIELNDLQTASLILNVLNSPALSKLSMSLSEDAKKIKKENEALLENEDEIIKRMRKMPVIPHTNFLKKVAPKSFDQKMINSFSRVVTSYSASQIPFWLTVAIDKQKHKPSMVKMHVLNKMDRAGIDKERKRQLLSKIDRAEIDKERKRQQAKGFIKSFFTRRWPKKSPTHDLSLNETNTNKVVSKRSRR